MIWGVAGGFAVGFCVGEYYRRMFDRVRREQISQMRGRGRGYDQDRYDSFEFDRPAPRRPLISEEQHEEYRKTGRTAGRYGGADNA